MPEPRHGLRRLARLEIHPRKGETAISSPPQPATPFDALRRPSSSLAVCQICFTKKLEDPASSWKRDYNRAVSGLHSAVSATIVDDLGQTQAGLAEYRRRLRDQPGAVTNLYFAYMLTLCAIHQARDRLNYCSYLGDGDHIKPLMQELTSTSLLFDKAVQRAAYNFREHAESASAEVWRMRMRHRDLKQMMGCVECNLCRVHVRANGSFVNPKP